MLDFRNEAKDILKAFLPFYRTAKLSGITDKNLVHALRQKLDAAQIYLWSEGETFARAYFDPKGKQAAIQAPLKQAHERFKAQTKEVQELFRGDLATYVVAYDFLSQLWDYDNPDLERLHAFAKCLLPRLYGKADGGDQLEGAARLAGYKLKDATDHQLSLEGGKAKPLKPMGPGTGEPWVDPRDRLSVIIRKMNEVFSGNLTEADYTGYATTLLSKLAEDPTLREQARANDTVEAFGNGAYEAKLNNAVVDALEKHSVMAEQALKYPIVFRGLANLPVDEVYLRLRAETPVAGAA